MTQTSSKKKRNIKNNQRTLKNNSKNKLYLEPTKEKKM